MGKPEMIMPAKINVRALAAVSKFASSEEKLNGVLVEIEPRAVTYVATDGRTLLAHRDEKISDAEIEPDNDLTGTFIIPTMQCRAFKIGKKDLGDAELTGDASELTIKRGGQGVVFHPIDGTFPDWRRVVPKLPLAQGIGQFNGHQAEKFMKVSEELGLGLPFLAHNGQSDPALVRFAATSETLGVVMPVQADDSLRMKPLPDWLEVPRAAAE